MNEEMKQKELRKLNRELNKAEANYIKEWKMLKNLNSQYLEIPSKAVLRCKFAAKALERQRARKKLAKEHFHNLKKKIKTLS